MIHISATATDIRKGMSNYMLFSYIWETIIGEISLETISSSMN